MGHGWFHLEEPARCWIQAKVWDLGGVGGWKAPDSDFLCLLLLRQISLFLSSFFFLSCGRSWKRDKNPGSLGFWPVLWRWCADWIGRGFGGTIGWFMGFGLWTELGDCWEFWVFLGLALRVLGAVNSQIVLGKLDFKVSVLIFWVEFVENTVQEHLIEVVGGHGAINISISICTRFVALTCACFWTYSFFLAELYCVQFPFSGWRQWFQECISASTVGLMFPFFWLKFNTLLTKIGDECSDGYGWSS